MSVFGPYDHFPGIVERKPGLIDLQVRDRPGVLAYRLWASSSVNNLYGDPAAANVGGDETARQMLLEIRAGKVYRSTSIIRRRVLLDENLKGTTRMIFDLKDFITAANPQPLPSDQGLLFVRLQQQRLTTNSFLTVQGATNNGDPIMGPILAVPPPSFFGMREPIISIQGNAPSNTGAVFGNPVPLDLDFQTPNPIHLVLPRPSASLVVRNLDAVNDLLVAFGLGMPMTRVQVGEDLSFDSGSIKEILLASEANGASCAFAVEATIAMEAA